MSGYIPGAGGGGGAAPVLKSAAGSEASPQTVTTNLGSWEDLTDLTHTFTTGASDIVLCTFSGQVRTTAGTANPHIALDLDGTRIRIIADNINGSTVTRSMGFTHAFVPGAGSHTVKLQGSKIAGDSNYVIEPTPITGTHEDSPHFQCVILAA